MRDSWLPGTDPVRLRVDRGRDGTTSDGYDTAGRLSGLDYPSGAGFEQDWSDRDEPTAMRAHGPGTTPTVYESQYTYDAAGNVATVTDPFGRVTT